MRIPFMGVLKSRTQKKFSQSKGHSIVKDFRIKKCVSLKLGVIFTEISFFCATMSHQLYVYIPLYLCLYEFAQNGEYFCASFGSQKAGRTRTESSDRLEQLNLLNYNTRIVGNAKSQARDFTESLWKLLYEKCQFWETFSTLKFILFK